MSIEKKYVAAKRLVIGGQYRQIGEPVPEANTWKNVSSWLGNRYIKEVKEDFKPLISRPVAQPVAMKEEEPKQESKQETKKEPAIQLVDEEPVRKDSKEDKESKKEVTKDKGYVCKTCDRKFLTKSGLKRHKTVSH